MYRQWGSVYEATKHAVVLFLQINIFYYHFIFYWDVFSFLLFSSFSNLNFFSISKKKFSKRKICNHVDKNTSIFVKRASVPKNKKSSINFSIFRHQKHTYTLTNLYHLMGLLTWLTAYENIIFSISFQMVGLKGDNVHIHKVYRFEIFIFFSPIIC